MMTASVRVSVLNNPYDQYTLKLKAFAYERDAIIDIDYNNENQSNFSVYWSYGLLSTDTRTDAVIISLTLVIIFGENETDRSSRWPEI